MYKGSTLDLNSPEINRIAYGPEMNAHVARLKEHRKKKGDSFKTDIGLEFADHVRFKDKAPMSVTISKKVTLHKVKPRYCFICKERVYTYHIINGKVYGDCHKSIANQPMFDQAKAIDKTKE